MAKISIDYEKLLDALNQCKTKNDLVSTVQSFGIKTKTDPTKTDNTSDLYFQLADGSRIHVKKTILKLWTSDKISQTPRFCNQKFKPVNDGSYRTQCLTVEKTPENLELLLGEFMENVANWN